MSSRQFRCNQGHTWEGSLAVQSLSEGDSPVTCPVCGGQDATLASEADFVDHSATILTQASQSPAWPKPDSLAATQVIDYPAATENSLPRSSLLPTEPGTDAGLLEESLMPSSETADDLVPGEIGSSAETVMSPSVLPPTPVPALGSSADWLNSADLPPAPPPGPSTGSARTILQKESEDVWPGGSRTIDQDTRSRTSPGQPSGPTGFDYEIKDELGRGGMGVVYKARQIKLNRIVALKMILAGEHASEIQLIRFRDEATAIAQFEHPNIVHVYEIGEWDNCPFFSLEYVDGGSLAGQIQKSPLSARKAAEVVCALARAMDYAHKRGIIHRDLKPANVLMTRDNQPKITDFGLAKKFEEEDSHTRTGAVLGTPSYMAPEQAEGKTKEVGPLADIYALGAILYDCLTGRPPFRGATPLETLLQVKSDAPVPPSQLQPKVPRDLETICLKTLEKDWRKRYATGGELADDLQRFLDGKPILARPASTLEKAVKWAKRKPAVATTVGLAAMIVLGVPVALGFYAHAQSELADQKQREADSQKREAEAQKVIADQQTRLAEQNARDAQVQKQLAYEQRKNADEARRNYLEEGRLRGIAEGEKKEAEKARDKAQREYVRAEKHFRRSQVAVYDMLTRVGGSRLDREENLDQVREELLKKAMSFYEEFLKEKSQDPDVRWDVARALFYIGDIQRQLQKQDAALRSYQSAVRYIEDLVKEDPKNTDYREALGEAYNNRGLILYDQKKLSQAAGIYIAARDLWKQLEKEEPGKIIYRANLAKAYKNLGEIQRTIGKFPEAEISLTEALKLQGELAKNAADLEGRLELGRVRMSVAELREQSGKTKEAELFARQAAAAFQQIVDQDKDHNPHFKQALGESLAFLARILRDRKRDEAKDLLLKTIAIRKDLVTGYPKRPQYRQELATAYNELAIVYQIAKANKDADDAYRNAFKTQEGLSAFAYIPEYGLALARTENSWGTYLTGKNDLTAAEKSYHVGEELLRNLIQKFPASRAVYQRELAKILTGLAVCLQSQGSPKKAEAAFSEALKNWEEIIQVKPTPVLDLYEFARVQMNLGVLSAAKNNLDEAKKHYDESLRILKELAAKFAGVQDFRYTLALVHNNLSHYYDVRKQPVQMQAALKEALQLFSALAQEFKRPDYYRWLAITYGELGTAQLNTGQFPEAEKNLSEAIGLCEALAKQLPADALYYWKTGSMYTGNLVNLLKVAESKPVELEKTRRSLVALLDKLVSALPNDLSFLVKRAKTLHALAEDKVLNRDPVQGRKDIEEALTDWRTLVKANPSEPTHIQGLGASYLVLLDALYDLKDHAAMAQLAAQVKEELPENWSDSHRVAEFLGKAILLMRKDSELDDSVRKEIAVSYGDLALQFLKRSQAAGYRPALRDSEDLKPLRKRADFKKLVEEMDQKAKTAAGSQ